MNSEVCTSVHGEVACVLMYMVRIVYVLSVHGEVVCVLVYMVRTMYKYCISLIFSSLSCNSIHNQVIIFIISLMLFMGNSPHNFTC